ncbi:adhesion G-protein coupled receptor G2-like isoform X2 [Galleria mellonella]|uniref:Adhesion G-protein coupled receptor G2-like isoform X2 n=1 Tax=Galleria mellonella TaxID=7137 RepID=A0ABM3MEZ7_GALME|nr:adhesion G-protein coupled receptor G2-like isoform X2 [Galleria mellonella]
MRLPHRIILYAIVFLLCIQVSEAKRSGVYLCPLGFKLAYIRFSDNYVCYKLKEPEEFASKLDNCDGNLYTEALYRNLIIPKIDEVDIVWADYKLAYPGGPFIGTSRTDYQDIIYNATVFPNYDTYQDLCLIVNKLRDYTAVRCDEKHFRYCIVKPYPETEIGIDRTGCNDYHQSWRFIGPREICLFNVSGHGGGPVRATWKQSQALCVKNGGFLLNRGWQYANFPLFYKSGVSLIPFDPPFHEEMNGLLFNMDTLVYYTVGSFGIKNDTVFEVNSSIIFYNVICEHSVQPRNIFLNLTINSDKLLLFTNNSVDKRNIYCYTDSETYYPTKVRLHDKKKNESEYNIYRLSADFDGYYWCVYVDPDNLHETESQKVLFLRDKRYLASRYAIKIRLERPYDYKQEKYIKEYWEANLETFIFCRTKYIEENRLEVKDFEYLDLHIEQIVYNFMSATDLSDSDVILDIKIRRMYMDKRTILFHVQLREDMIPLDPVKISNDEVLFMKPVYICKSQNSLSLLPLNSSKSLPGCRTYKCVGDYDEGVSLVEEATPDCSVSSSVAMTETVVVRNNEPTPIMPTFETEASSTPEDQLEQVLNDLDTLLQDNSITLTVEKIEDTFDQVDNLFDIGLEAIPGRLLNLLDDLGSRVYLNGSRTGATIRKNIALLVADAAPENPVRGFRLANSSGTNDFTDFQFLAEDINTTHLMTNESEALVYLPESVTKSPRRISFVVFRNELAFQCTKEVGIVNSKVVSVNVGNMTTFENGEVIDIHLSPLVEEPDRNASRTCAYWEFTENGTGYWSTNGCTFIKSTEPGILDTCRCDHLTHFAEILIPRTIFSQRHEDTLEILSIIGCSLSLFGIILIMLTAVMFRPWRREFSNRIWLQLCIAIFLISICFMIIVFVKFDGYDIPCMLVGVMLHYSVLASFCWMLVAAVISYRRLVLVFTREISHKLLRASAFSWGAPFVVVGVLLSVEPFSYAVQFEEKSPSGSFCYPSGLSLWLAVYAPVALMLLANWTLFILIVRSVFASRRIQRHGDSNDALRCACVSCLLVFLFGLPWIFGLFAYNIVAAYFFTCTATLQGFVLFIFIIVGNKKTRDLWLNKLKIKQTRKIPVTSSTYTNRSVAGVSRGRDRSVSSMEANNLKPRSLASDDDSKFS